MIFWEAMYDIEMDEPKVAKKVMSSTVIFFSVSRGLCKKSGYFQLQITNHIPVDSLL
jgi:hypothetical protein